MLCDGLGVGSNIFCTFRHIVRQRAYVIDDAIIYSKRPLLRLRPLPSNNELSAVKAHYMKMTIRSSKSKPEVEFPYGVRLFSKCGSSSISAMDIIRTVHYIIGP